MIEEVAKQDELSQIDEGATRKECSQTPFSNSVASLSNIENIITIPITQLNKYIVICEVHGLVSTNDIKKIRMLAKSLGKWWDNSDDKFFVLVQGDDIPTIRFERLEKEPNI